MNRKVLIFGGGAREHALAVRLFGEGWQVVVAPGNAAIARKLPCQSADLGDLAGCVALAGALEVDLVVVGPEAPLVAGLADALRAAKIPVFGPTAAAARIEGSKAFAKEVMVAARVPTAGSRVFTDGAAARAFAAGRGGKVAVKADGLAAGKGVTVCGSTDESDRAIAALLEQGTLGAAGRTVVIEERLSGPEVSLFALCSGTAAVPLPLSHDYKRLKDADAGPNTGGMGAVAPSSRWSTTEDLTEDLIDLTIRPVLSELERRGAPFSGLLYAGLMLTPDGPRVIEYNCRFGNPETQVVLQVLDGPLGEALLGIARDRVEVGLLRRSGRVAVGVVAAASGYPEAPRAGDEIRGWDEAEHAATALFAAGVGARDGKLVTSGGRVATVVGSGEGLAAARTQAYAALSKLAFAGLTARADIGVPEKP